MTPIGFKYVWLIWSSAFMLPWLALYVLVPGVRRIMLRASVPTAAFGLTEPIFVPAYWNPPSLFKSAVRQRRYESTPPVAASDDVGHNGHATPSAPPTSPTQAVPTTTPTAPVAEDKTPPDQQTASAPAKRSPVEPVAEPATADGDAQKENATPNKE